MIPPILLLLLTVPGGFVQSKTEDKRLLVSDQTVLHETVQKLQTELQQLKAEVEQLRQSKSGM